MSETAKLRQPLRCGWTLARDPSDAGRSGRWFETGVPSDGALPASVPSFVHMYFPDYYGVAWYETRFVPSVSAGEGERALLRFEKAVWLCEVWLNGSRVGSHTGTDMPFEFDVTGLLAPGRENLLSVRVSKPHNEPVDGFSFAEIPHRNQLKQGIMPGTCLNTFGIHGDVELAVVPRLRIADAFVSGDAARGAITARVTVENCLPEAAICTVAARCGAKRSGETPYSAEAQLTAAPGRSEISLEIPVADVRLWSPDNPFLYEVSLELRQSAAPGKPAARDSLSKRAGFRDFRVGADGFFYLNGKRIFLRSSHTGNCFLIGEHAPLDDDTWFKDMYMAKAIGLNCVRFIAGAASESQLDYCDELGLMVYEEPMSSWNLGSGPRCRELYMADLVPMIVRDRSHACVTVWGLLNEMHVADDVYKIARDSLPELRELDPTRLIMLSSGRWDGEVRTGSVSNPGSDRWECLWDGEDESSDELTNNPPNTPGAYYLKVGDKHAYPHLPVGKPDAALLRSCGADTGKPVFLSEFGIGSLLDTKWLLRSYEQRISGSGADAAETSDTPDITMVRKMEEQLMRDYYAYGLDSCFTFPRDLLVESQKLSARHRAYCFDLVRSNPRICGYNITGLLDHSICGEGLWTLTRDWKPGVTDAVADGLAPLKWCLFTSDTNVYRRREFSVEGVLANENVLSARRYDVAVRISGPDGVVFSRDISLDVTPRDLELMSVPVFRFGVSLDVPEGEYALRAELVSGAAATGGTLRFFVTDGALTKAAPGASVAAAALPESALAFLREKGVGVTDLSLVPDDFQGTILVGAVGDDDKDSVWQKVGELIGRGCRAIAVSRFALQRGEDCLAYLPVEDKPDRFPHGADYTDWLYHKEYIAKRHPFFAGLPCGGIMDFDYYMRVISGACFFGGKLPDDVAAACVGPGNLNPNGYEGGFNLASYRVGNGSVVVNSFNILENIGVNPAADRLFINLINAGFTAKDGESPC